MNRMVRWIEKNIDPESKIIDLGCGNGMMSIELYEAGFHNVDGVDYSENAIDLAKKLALASDIEDLNFFVSTFFIIKITAILMIVQYSHD